MKLPTRADQQARRFPTPPRWLIPWTTRLHVWVYENSGGRLYTRAMKMHHLVLRSVGRKSGRPAAACLPFWLDANEERIVIASMAGGPRHPAWYHNVRDLSVNPEVIVRDKRRVFWARAEIVEGEDRATIWKELTRDRPFYQSYQDQTTRRIPVIRLVETRPYEDSEP